MENSISSDLIRGHIDTIILCTLVAKDKFPNEISQEINEKTDGSYQINQATLYSSLKRLESLKHVTSYWHDADIGGRRKYYHLTDEGKSAIDENAGSWNFSRTIIDRLVNTNPDYVTQIKSENNQQNTIDLQNEELKSIKTENQKLLAEINELKNRPPEVQVKTVYVKDTSLQNDSLDNFNNTNNNVQPVYQKPKQVVRQSSQQKQETDYSENVFSVNYRDVLGSIISSSNVVLEYNKSDDEDTVQQNTISQFVEEVRDPNKGNNKVYSGQMDFTDLSEKLSHEGFKLRVSRQSTRPITSLQYINRMKLTSVLSVYFLFLIELLIVSFCCSDLLGLKLWHYLLIFFVSLIVPVGSYLALKHNLDKYSAVAHNFKDPLLIAGIVLFNCLLLDVTMIILLEVNLSNTATLLASLIFPILIMFDVLCYFILNYILYNKRVFRV